MAGFGQRLCNAAEAGDALVVRKLLRRLPHIDVNSRGREMYGHTALSKAARSSLLSILMSVYYFIAHSFTLAYCKCIFPT